MENPHEDWQHNKLTEGNKVVHSATFTVLYIPDYIDGLSYMYGLLILIISTELQWLVFSPDNYRSDQMIKAILLLQTVVNAQKNYLLYNNKITGMIYLTYGIVLANIITVAFVAFVDMNKGKGYIPWLTKHRGSVFRTVRI